jgi:hypothetical protein
MRKAQVVNEAILFEAARQIAARSEQAEAAAFNLRLPCVAPPPRPSRD